LLNIYIELLLILACLLTNLRHSSRCPSLFYFNFTNGCGEDSFSRIEFIMGRTFLLVRMVNRA